MKEQFVKRLVIGDIHGRVDLFSKIYEQEKSVDGSRYDVILLGDYLDTHEDISPEQQVDGLKLLLALQKKHQNEQGKFTMLMGNHDFHYFIDDIHEHYSGYNVQTHCMANPILVDAVKSHKIKFAYADIQNRTIYSHAGVTNTWINTREKVSIPINMIDLAPIDSFKFTYGKHFDPYGNDPLNGPLWVRPQSLIKDMYADYDNDIHKVVPWTQIVGHTSCKNPIIAREDGSQWSGLETVEDWRYAKFWDIDCLSKGYYMVEEINEDGYVINRNIEGMNVG